MPKIKLSNHAGSLVIALAVIAAVVPVSNVVAGPDQIADALALSVYEPGTPFVVVSDTTWRWELATTSGDHAIEVSGGGWTQELPEATWIWSPECDAGQTPRFTKNFDLPPGFEVAKSQVELTADDFVSSLEINGTNITLPNDLVNVWGNWDQIHIVPVPTDIFTTENTISVVGRNAGTLGETCNGNPAGLIFKLTLVPKPELPLRYLAINAGAFGLECWKGKLCREQDVASLRAYIQTWQPDVIMLSEIFRADQLYGTAQFGPILPAGYTGKCGESRDRDTGELVPWNAENASGEHECVAWKISRLSYVVDSARPVYGSCEDGFGFTGFRAKLLLEESTNPITAVAVHPHSTNATCRTEEIARYWQELADGEAVIIGGDWNTNEPQELQVPERFKINYSGGQHWDIVEHPDEWSAFYGPVWRQIDHTYSSFGIPCLACGAVYGTDDLTYGSALGGYDEHPTADGGGMDHRQILVDMDVRSALNTFTVRMTSPDDGAVFGPNPVIGLSADASSPAGPIAKIDFYDDDGSGTPALIFSDNSAPFGTVFDPVSLGDHSLTAIATDSAGNTAVSDPITITSSASILADLEARFIYFDAPLRPGVPNAAWAYLINIGDAHTGVFNVRWLINGEEFGGTHASLAPGEVSSGNALYLWTPTLGEHTLRFESDVYYNYVPEYDENNNDTEVTVLVENKADLEVSNIQFSILNGVVTAKAHLKNVGLAESDVFNVKWYLDGVEVDYAGNNSLLPGQVSGEAAVYYEWTPHLIDHEIRFEADVDNHVDEYVEVDNNSRTENFHYAIDLQVSITSPNDGDVFSANSPITVIADASPEYGIARVEFYASKDSQPAVMIGQEDHSPYAINWTDPQPGSYTLWANVYDTVGGALTSESINITVANNQAPIVEITEPSEGAEFAFGSPIAIVADASDPDGSIDRVEFYAKTFSDPVAIMIGQENSLPYGIWWTNAQPGTYNIWATAYDNLGGSRTSLPVTITVKGNAPPTIRIDQPINGAVFPEGSDVEFQFTVSDSDGQVTLVELYLDGVLQGNNATAPFGMLLLNMSPGSYRITAKAFDDAGASAVSDPVNITIQENMPPTVSIDQPTDGQVFQAGSDINVGMTASDPDGQVARVELYVDGVLRGSRTVAPYNLLWENVPAGSYSLSAIAYDNSGASAKSRPVNITVTGYEGMIVRIDYPATGDIFPAGSDIDILITATNPNGLVDRVEVYVNFVLQGADSIPPYGLHWSGVPAGRYALTARAYDSEGRSVTSRIVDITVTGEVIFEDIFDRPTGTDLGPGWEERSGEWGLLSNQLYVSGGQRSLEGTCSLLGCSAPSTGSESPAEIPPRPTPDPLRSLVLTTDSHAAQQFAIESSFRVASTITQSPTFADVAIDHDFYNVIEALYQAGYTAGCQAEPLLFCPEATMNRAESAVFVQRGIHGAGVLPSAPTSQVFADLSLDSWGAKWATALYEDSFTAGCGEAPLVYCPWQGHTRTEGTVFYLRMLNGANYLPPEPVGVFADVALDFWGADWIEAAYEAGLIPACGENPLRFCPEDPLTRAVAAYMMVQAKGLPLPLAQAQAELVFGAAEDGSGGYRVVYDALRGQLDLLAPGGSTLASASVPAGVDALRSLRVERLKNGTINVYLDSGAGFTSSPQLSANDTTSPTLGRLGFGFAGVGHDFYVVSVRAEPIK